MEDSFNIYIITTMSKLDLNDLGWPSLGSHGAVGYYRSFKDAEKAVTTNSCDIWETCYEYACIEEVEEGLYPSCINRWFYKYNIKDDTYEPVEPPEEYAHTCGFWM